MKQLIFILMLLPALSISQIAYHDAIELRKLNPQVNGTKLIFPIANNSNILASEILKKYTTGLNYGQIQTALATNPFVELPLVTSSSSLAINSKNNFFSSVGNLNVTNIADGLAKFLVARTKQELSVTFFQQFEDKLNDVPELGIIFPNTTQTFTIIESFKFSAYLNSLRQSFLKDLENLNTNLLKLQTLSNYAPFFATNPGLLTKIGLNLVEDFKRGANPAEIISAIASDPSFNSLPNANFQNLKNAIQLTDLLSSSFLNKDPNITWVSANEINNMISDPLTFKIYLGLIFQVNENSTNPIVFKTTTSTVTLKSILQNWSTYKTPIENYIKSVVQDYDNVNSAISNIRNLKKAGNQPNHSDYYTFYSSVVSFMKTSSSIHQLSGDNTQKPEIDEFLKIAENAGNIYHDLASQNYSAAIIDIIAFLKHTKLVTDQDVLDDFLKYGSFMASVGEANNSDEVQAAIEAIALPAGSATIKKRSVFNVSLNAYLGLAGGREYNGDTEKTKWYGAVHAPVGVALSWSISGLNKNDEQWEAGSITLFASVVDLGAITSFRFDDSETEELPEIKLENIIAPGGYLVYGLPNIPISIGAGFQLGPQLREVTAMDLSIDSDPNFSFGAFIAVDIPLLNFYTKSR